MEIFDPSKITSFELVLFQVNRTKDLENLIKNIQYQHDWALRARNSSPFGLAFVSDGWTDRRKHTQLYVYRYSYPVNSAIPVRILDEKYLYIDKKQAGYKLNQTQSQMAIILASTELMMSIAKYCCYKLLFCFVLNFDKTERDSSSVCRKLKLKRK